MNIKYPLKNLIFDFGGVIIEIDPMAYVGEIQELGCNDLQGMHESFLKDGVYRQFETGTLSAEAFRARIRKFLPDHAPDSRIDHAWNLIIGGIPEHRVRFLESLRSKYRTFLLSNTNPIHYGHYQDYVRKTFHFPSLDSLFEKAYYSFQIGRYKPDLEIFEFVLQDSGLNPSETLFIDDMEENIVAARQCGLQGLHVPEGADFMELMKSLP